MKKENKILFYKTIKRLFLIPVVICCIPAFPFLLIAFGFWNISFHFSCKEFHTEMGWDE